MYNWNLLKAESEASSFLNKRHREKEIREVLHWAWCIEYQYG
jgi:hypothetical protein